MLELLHIDEVFKDTLPEGTQAYQCAIVNRLEFLREEYSLEPAHCQRPLVWTAEQYENYVKHVLSSPKNAGEFIFALDLSTESYYIVDGQHRLEALRRWVDREMELEVEGKTYNSSMFYPISGAIVGTMREVLMKTYDKDLVQRIYDAHNFSGVAHTK